MKYTLLCYEKCGTCRKAQKWLVDNGLAVEQRSIVQEKPLESELKKWISLSGLPIAKFFNTSGKLYREHTVKDKVKQWSEAELTKLLASDGMMVKRPLLVADNFVLVGFNEQEWGDKLL